MQNFGPQPQPQQQPRRTIQVQDPTPILWLHQTVSPKFSQGAKPGQPGEKIERVAAQLEKKPEMALDFPPLQVFTLTDPDDHETHIYSLSNRRLLAFKTAGIKQAKVQPTKFRDVMTSLWKMTSKDGGYSFPKATMMDKQNDCEPDTYTTLGKFKREMQQLIAVHTAHCVANNIVGEAREDYIKAQLKQVARQRFQFS